jgi:riboflavin kinase/FMN adenylyltransferase
MKVLKSIGDLGSVPGPVALAIGVFDGVHRGHQEVIRSAQEFAAQHSGTAVVLTFDPHPLNVLRPGKGPRLLCSSRHKLMILQDLGITHAVVQTFDENFAATQALDFIQSLSDACRPLGFISVGYSWRFGQGGAGDIHLLMDAGHQMGFGVYGVPSVQVDGLPVSSTAIREAVKVGDFSLARTLLGRDYTVLGSIVEGRKLGRQIGFPTANLDIETEQLPPPGVYAVTARVNGIYHKGVANLGFRPTLEEKEARLKLEVHLFDFAGDLYGQDAEVTLVSQVRSEIKFSGLEELKTQIALDCAEARRILNESSLTSPIR